MRAYPADDPKHYFYRDLREGLEKQFFNKVLVKPTKDFPFYRTTNFLDGNNGVYRWNYQSLGPNKGYGPYELSGTLALGWWAFLESERVRALYRDLAQRYPESKDLISFYLGPTGTRTRPASELDPQAPGNRLRLLIMQLASEL